MADTPAFSQKFVFKRGGLWETPEWEIHYDARIRYSNSTCPHCKPTGDKQFPFICPRVVVSVDRSGRGGAGICLDCILEEVVPPDED